MTLITVVPVSGRLASQETPLASGFYFQKRFNPIGVAESSTPIRKSPVTFHWKFFWWHVFFNFHIHICDAFWLNLMVVSFQFLKLWPFFERRSSQNDDFAVKTLCKWQIIEIANNLWYTLKTLTRFYLL